ncbi:MAG: PIN domain-containing protein [Propionibacteriaceae bacterium]|nr:PIN domain-containing protein [Propionibacteriaceae bacterium]
MTESAVVLADANVLIPRTLRDYVVYLGKAGAFELRWSQAILDETSRNLVAGFGFTPEDARELELRLVEYLPWALIEPSDLDRRTAAAVAMDPKDRHVLAAALTARASAIVTDNDRHFPHAWMADHGMELLRASDLLSRAAARSPDALR